MTTALITTCFREAAAIDAFLDAILAQTRAADEIIIVDAGSDDGTVEAIQARIDAGAPLRLIVEPGANRSRGRNRAIEETEAEVIAATDVGTLPQADWFEKITDLFRRETGISENSTPEPGESSRVDVVGGFYQTNPSTLWQAAVCAATVPTAAEVDPDTFLPSARSVAFRRAAWEAVGGYPEWAWDNEDTPFGLALRAAGLRFVFEPRAVVEWRPQVAPRRLFVQFWRYARGDGQCGIWFRHYGKAYAVLGATLALVVSGTAWPSAFLGLGVLWVAYWARHAMRARRRTPSLPAALLAPLANAIVDAAHVVGYAQGWWGRGKGK